MSEQPRIRRHATKTSFFKQKNAKIDVRLKGKTKKVQRDVGVESPEFQLLVRLYVPSNLLITNNKVERKELMKYLPTIVNDELPELNFELHIFLSCIVSRYVLSWYSLKLNTDDTTFISQVYLVLCEFVRDFSARVLKVVESPLLLHAVNDAGTILAKHIKDNRIENGVPSYYTEYKMVGQSVLYDDDDHDTIKQRYLAANHVIFDPSALEVGDEKVPTDDPLDIYARALSKNILRLTLSKVDAKNTEISPIGYSLVSAILGDLVLRKVIHLLSKPEFILKNVIAKPVSLLPKSTPHKRAPSVTNSIFRSLKEYAKALLTILNDIRTFWKQQAESNDYPTLECCFLVLLLDSLFMIKRRRPVAMSIGGSLVSILFYVLGLKQKIESVIGSFILIRIWLSTFLEDSRLAGIVKNLRESVFERTQSGKTEPHESNSDILHTTRDNMLSVFKHTVSSGLVLGSVLQWLSDEDANESDIRESIEKFLSIFNNGSADELQQASDLNTLLAVSLIDCIIKYLYPELIN